CGTGAAGAGTPPHRRGDAPFAGGRSAAGAAPPAGDHGSGLVGTASGAGRAGRGATGSRRRGSGDPSLKGRRRAAVRWNGDKRRDIMLSHEDNETLVRVGPGTTMGGMMRLYWLPFFASKDLERNGQPQTVKLLGETLVVFRDSEGNVGLVDHICPHRGAPMVFARNEDCGLRCVYHGWKFT